MPSNPRYLGQVVAIEADVRKSTMRELTDAYHALDKPALLEGLQGDYEPHAEEGERLPSESQRVQATVNEMLAATKTSLTKLFDVTAARDFTNASGAAKADVVVGDQVLIPGAPVPYLLWLDRKLDELQAFALRIPTLPPSTTWSLAEDRGVYRSAEVKTVRQVQQPKVVTLAAATDKHPAQVQLFPEQVGVGTWTRVKFSGAVPVDQRARILQRIAILRAAVHAAREQANRVQAEEPQVGARVLSYLFD
jgi:hypothetical protein